MGQKKLSCGMMDILLEIASGRTNATIISERINLPLSTIHSRLRNLEEEGFLKSIKTFNVRNYELTSIGNEATTKFRDPSKEAARRPGNIFAHKVSWSMRIAKEPEWLRDELRKTGFIASMHRNWLSLNREFDDHTISFHKNRVFVYFTEFSLDKGPIDYYPVASLKMAKVKEFLERQFKGLVLTDPRQHAKYRIHNQHIVEKFGDVAMRFAKVRRDTGQKVIYHGKNFNVDFSKGDPEQEFVNKTGAVADALGYAEFVDGFCEAPFRAKDIQEQGIKIESVKEEVSGVQDGIKAILQENSSISEVLKGLTDLQKQQTGSMDVFARAMNEHLVLVKALQEVAYKTKEGMESNAKAILSVAESVKELATPWYVKLWRKVKEIFHKK